MSNTHSPLFSTDRSLQATFRAVLMQTLLQPHVDTATANRSKKGRRLTKTKTRSKGVCASKYNDGSTSTKGTKTKIVRISNILARTECDIMLLWAVGCPKHTHQHTGDLPITCSPIACFSGRTHEGMQRTTTVATRTGIRCVIAVAFRWKKPLYFRVFASSPRNQFGISTLTLPHC